MQIWLNEHSWIIRLVVSQIFNMICNLFKHKKAEFRKLTMEPLSEWNDSNSGLNPGMLDNELTDQFLVRPQFVRDSFLSLDGMWKLANTDAEKLPDLTLFNYKCRVPYAPESDLSECDCKNLGEVYWYYRSFNIEADFVKSRILLHFGAVDQIAEIYVNGTKICDHEGGYLPFEVDITKSAKIGNNSIYVRITDKLDQDYPYGKQSKDRGGMWYTPISGIWQSVWLESVPDNYIKSMKVNTTCKGYVRMIVDLSIHNKLLSSKERFSLTCEEEYSIVKKNVYRDQTSRKVELLIRIRQPELWTPDHPKLYRFRICYGKDTIQSYFALREVKVEKTAQGSRIMLNNKPIFMQGVLDQGYFCDGIYTPDDPNRYLKDILYMKDLGFNTLRKHIKIEPECFYYFCDKYGMIIMQDMVNNGHYSFIRDTALPTITLFSPSDVNRFGTKKQKQVFINHCRDTIRHLYNHPSICYYTIFNEGWGQFDSDRIYGIIKKADPTRVVDSTSGWFKQQKSDVLSNHTYYHRIHLPGRCKKPYMVSECGGFSYKIMEHSYNQTLTYGYGVCKNKEQLTRRIVRLYEKEVIPAFERGLCGCIYTQLSDVEDETNGLYTYDRKICKVDPIQIRNVNKKIQIRYDLLFHKK